MLNRFSSRKTNLGTGFLSERLKGACSYDRIAGYFCSSVLDIAGEGIENIKGKARIICNGGIHADDVKVAGLAEKRIRQEWCDYDPVEKFNTPKQLEWLERFYNLLMSGKLEVRVVPDDVFGLIHGKAGVITYPDGKRTAFVGSINETRNALSANYEIVWEDATDESADWVQEEFDFFWKHGIPLSKFVISDIKRIVDRKVLSIKDWRDDKDQDIGSVVAEEPIYRKDDGLWPHQKYFVLRAFREHKTQSGARLVLADKVGLGKTLQLAMAAKLMALYGQKPVLIIVPKTLMEQWQDSMATQLDMPSARWVGNGWMDEKGTFYPSDILHCPRRVGIVSQALVSRVAESSNGQKLLELHGGYECVICDEAHHARRNNLNNYEDAYDTADPNNLLRFLRKMSFHTHSMLLGTATPIQLDPIEIFDLMDAISLPKECENILGDKYGLWRRTPRAALGYVMQEEPYPKGEQEMWSIVRDPLPASVYDSNRDISTLRDQIAEYVTPYNDDVSIFRQSLYDNFPKRIKERIQRLYEDSDFIRNYNPYIRNVVCRTRELLENTVNPDTGKPYLEKIDVQLFGDSASEAITLPPYMRQAYREAERFCELLSEDGYGSGLFSTIMLRRIGSTMLAGLRTAQKFARWSSGDMSIDDVASDTDETDDDIDTDTVAPANGRVLSPETMACVKNIIKCLEENKALDPKYQLTLKLLTKGCDEDGPWVNLGCIIFSQYYDSAMDIAEKLHTDMRVDGRYVDIALYSGNDKSGIFHDGKFEKCPRATIKGMVRRGEIKVLVGTDAASEGLDLQSMSTLINIDLPWNPTRLEQRKGRIQRIGQLSPKIKIYNMRYKDSIEDTVHQRLSERFGDIHALFGQIPDTIEDVWISAARDGINGAVDKINNIPVKNPFIIKYEETIPICGDWEKTTAVLDRKEKLDILNAPW